jgi:hypothetical protein
MKSYLVDNCQKLIKNGQKLVENGRLVSEEVKNSQQ